MKYMPYAAIAMFLVTAGMSLAGATTTLSAACGWFLAALWCFIATVGDEE